MYNVRINIIKNNIFDTCIVVYIVIVWSLNFRQSRRKTLQSWAYHNFYSTKFKFKISKDCI